MIPIYKPFIEGEELEAAALALRQGWLGMGSYVEAFEQTVEKAVQAGSRRAAAVSTGSAALHLAAIIAGVQEGDEVVVPSLTHLADVQAIRAVGAQPVLCDVEDATLCIDPERAAELIGPRTRAIVAMDYGCHLCDYPRVAALADQFGLRVIHDAAHSFGSARAGQPVGSFSDICMFSFDPCKALSCIDAGILMVRDEAELLRVRALRALGSTVSAEIPYAQQRSWHYDATECGFRYHLSNVHAAIGLAQIAKLDHIRATRQAACDRYRARLSVVEGLLLPRCDLSELNPFLYYVRVTDGRRDALRQHLAERGIETGIHWTPVHHVRLFRDCRRGSLAVTERAAREMVSLPLHSDMTTEVVDRVCDAVLAFFFKTAPARLPIAGTPRRTDRAPLGAAAPSR